MSTNAAVKKLHTSLVQLKDAKTEETSAEAKVTGAKSSEKTELASIQAQKERLIDGFTTSPPTGAAATRKALGQIYALGAKSVTTQDHFTSVIAKDSKAVTADKKRATDDRQVALKDLKPAEYHLNLKDTNAARKQLGLKAVSKPIRVSESKGLSKAVNLAMRAVALQAKSGAYSYTQDAGGPGDSRTNCGAGVLSRVDGKQITYDCSGFVGALYKDAGLKAPYTVGYTGTSFDVAGNPNMQKVSESQAKPGDVVVFPDHIALYIGHGNCVSMGGQGDPKVFTVAAEAAYENRGIQGFYHLKGA